MTIETKTLTLPASLYRQLQQVAKQHQTNPVDLIAQWLSMAQQNQPLSPADELPSATTPAFQQILAVATDLGINDLAAQHDHYLYGIEKR